jgi:hypothetical protein
VAVVCCRLLLVSLILVSVTWSGVDEDDLGWACRPSC